MIETSSMMSVVARRQRSPAAPRLIRSATSCTARESLPEIPAKSWMVAPPMLSAAMPVGAVTYVVARGSLTCVCV